MVTRAILSTQAWDLRKEQVTLKWQLALGLIALGINKREVTLICYCKWAYNYHDTVSLQIIMAFKEQRKINQSSMKGHNGNGEGFML